MMGMNELSERTRSLLSEARKMLSSAYAEYEEATKTKEEAKLRKSCEAGWLSIVKATDSLLEKHGVGAGKSHRDRRDKLRNLESSNPEIAKLGLRDRYMARMSYLHIDGFYEGAVDPDLVVEQLGKVEEYLNDVTKQLGTKQKSG